MPNSAYDVRFSNRPSRVKHFQTIHDCSVDVARGLALLFGIGTKALPSWDSRTRRNDLSGGLAVRLTAGPSGHANSPHPSSRVSDDQVLYRASKFDCTPCPLKSRCCPKEPVRKIPRSIFEQSRDVVRSLVGTALYERSRRERNKMEMLFAHLKRIIGLRRLRLRGPPAERRGSFGRCSGS
jgi:hypothetical protein